MMNIIFSEARLSQIFWTWGVGCDVKAQLAFPRGLQRYKLDFNTQRTLTVFFLKMIRNGAMSARKFWFAKEQGSWFQF